MSLIEEYGERRFQKGFKKGFKKGFEIGFEIGYGECFDKSYEEGVKIGRKRFILSLLESGMSAEEILRFEVFTIDEILEAEKSQAASHLPE
ncbi:hypothetical protein [Methanobrevibacter sp.]|uniref:hypothetical protein n=1 Tax=Methanobrevibacter sp. TaxID=66852 RepID=UPI00388D623E